MWECQCCHILDGDLLLRALGIRGCIECRNSGCFDPAKTEYEDHTEWTCLVRMETLTWKGVTDEEMANTSG